MKESAVDDECCILVRHGIYLYVPRTLTLLYGALSKRVYKIVYLSPFCYEVALCGLDGGNWMYICNTIMALWEFGQLAPSILCS